MSVLNKFYAESWNIAYRYKPQGSILNDINTPFKIIKNPYYGWLADPFVFEKNNKTYIFAELFDYIKRKGVIVYAELENDRITKWNKIIELQHKHLSYPFIFEYNDKIYIIPESQSSNKLLLYKAKSFPDKWEQKEILSDVKLTDTTLYNTEYGFISLSQEVNSLNPVVSIYDKNLNFKQYGTFIGPANNNVIRPGGKIGKIKDYTLVVCQDCIKDYGKGLYFYKSVINNNSIHVVDTFLHITPYDIKLNQKMFLDGMHTYNATDKIEIIDIKTKRFSLLDFFCRIKSHIG